MASHRTASRYWAALVFLITVALIGGYVYYVYVRLEVDLDRLSANDVF